ncbi:MAG: porin [Rhodocyclaceae bacterium]|nr:porin [Rhodocyclaceae bacterium]
MQKKVIALAVAGLMSGAAFAQSNVTISGRVDMSYIHTSANGNGTAADTTSGIDSGHYTGSRIAFDGEEALGNGLKAIFHLEYGIGADTAAGPAGARQQYIGLSGNMGTVMAGRQNTASDDMDDALGATDLSPRFLLTNNSLALNTSTKWNNSVRYVSPELLGGLTASAMYSFAPKATDSTAYNATSACVVTPTNTCQNDQERGYGIGLAYAAGPLSAALYYDRVSEVANTFANANGIDAKTLSMMGRYDFGMVALMGTYERAAQDSNIAGVSPKHKLWTVGATMPVGANGLARAIYGKIKANDYNATDVGSDKGTGWGLGYEYNLSKRTMAYAQYGRATGDDNLAVGTGTTAGTLINNTTATGTSGRDSFSGYMVGMIHRF